MFGSGGREAIVEDKFYLELLLGSLSDDCIFRHLSSQVNSRLVFFFSCVRGNTYSSMALLEFYMTRIGIDSFRCLQPKGIYNYAVSIVACVKLIEWLPGRRLPSSLSSWPNTRQSFQFSCSISSPHCTTPAKM